MSVTSSGARIGGARVADLQALVTAAAASSGVVGGQVCVLSEDQEASFVFGSANAELGVAMAEDTIVQVGSVTKLINAAMILSLVDDGALDLDVPVGTYVPDLQLRDAAAQASITLRQLLSMTSGLDNGHAAPLRGDDALARYVRLLRDIPQIFAPGAGFGYSSAGSCIAGYAAQKVTGATWDSLIEERILAPAGLEHAATLPEQLPYHRVSAGHAPARCGRPAKVVRPWYVSQGAAPGGATLATTARDLAEFGRLFINGGRASNGARVVSETAVARMTTPTVDVPTAPKWGAQNKWGLGPSQVRWGDTVVWGHAGGNQSGGAQLVWIPQKRAVLAFTLNTIAAFDPFTTQMFGDFSDAVFGVSAPRLAIPDRPAWVENPARFAGTYGRNGLRYEVAVEAGRLRFRELNLGRGAPGEAVGVAFEGELVPLGDDRFIASRGRADDAISLAFFGADPAGRATNLLAPLFASRRLYD